MEEINMRKSKRGYSFDRDSQRFWDGPKRLAAAVVLRALRDLDNEDPTERHTAKKFLTGRMYPYRDILDLPEGMIEDNVARMIAERGEE